MGVTYISALNFVCYSQKVYFYQMETIFLFSYLLRNTVNFRVIQLISSLTKDAEV